MTRSPTLKTLWIGSQPGVWKTSPRKPSVAPSAGAEFANSVASWGMPAAAIASGSAGITPPLARMAAKFRAPPAAITSSPGMWRLTTRKAPSSR